MMSEYLKICEKAARVGGAILREMLGNVWVREKKPADLVTEADFASQKAIRDTVLEAFPDHAFLGEETDPNLPNPLTDGSREFCWVVDPLDGTTNFVHHVPLFASSVALVRHGREILCGTVFNPMFDECFCAAAGKGAFLNGRPIHVSPVTEISEALASVSFPTLTQPDSPDLHAFLQLLPLAQAIRRTGSTAINMAYVAAGRFDTMVCYGANAWDVAAGTILVREAGGIVTAPDGSAFDLADGKTLTSSTEILQNKILRLINKR
ncbi:MAG: inositol monophosphatase [Planctomycetaceae bacterium]|nr:inositol monophosphatase [Planctomycetaceae bacterium]